MSTAPLRAADTPVTEADFDAFVSRRDTSSLKWDRYKGTDILPFWVADMDFPVAEPILQALQARLEHPMFGYGVAPDSLVSAVLEHLGREFDWRVEPDWVVWLPGVVTGLAVSCRAFCDDGDQIIMNPPIYHHFFHVHEADRQTLVRVPLRREQDGRRTWDIEAMRAACTDRTRLLLLCSPHNPVGTVFRQDELDAVAKLAMERDLIVVSDEIHCDLVIDPAARHLPTARACPDIAARTVTLMSGSKAWNLAGLNCSFAIIEHASLRDAFRAACRSIVPPVPPLAYTATEAAYRHGGPWRSAALDYLVGNFRLIEDAFAQVPGVVVEPIQATYLAWMDVRGLGLDNAHAFFESAGVGLSAGEQFGEPGYLRMNFACPREMLREGLSRMLAAIEKLHA